MTVLDTRRAGVTQAPRKPAPEGRGGLPDYTNQQQLNTGFVPRINTSAFAAPGRGVAAVGSALGGLAGALDAHNKKNQNYEAALGFAKLQGDLQRQEFTHKTTHEAPDGARYATDWNVKANQIIGTFKASLTEEQLQKYGPALQRVTDGYSNKAATHQYGKTQKYQKDQFNNSYTIHHNLLLKDPGDEQYENSKLALENQIDARDIPEPQKARDKATLRRQLDLTRALAYSKTGQFDKAEAAMEGLRNEYKDAATNKKPAQNWKGKDIKGGIVEAASALGINPVDLATAISYETAGTFNPVKRGPRTQWGRHKGLIQWGEPQAKRNGVDWKNPVKSQLGANGAIVKYLRNAGVKKGMGLLDIYSAINAGRVGRYNASDANNGGAPGTVRDKVQKQMRGHRQKAIKLLGGDTNLKFSQDVPAMPEKYKATVDKIDKYIQEARVKHQETVVIGTLKGKPSLAIANVVDTFRDQLEKTPDNAELVRAVKTAEGYLKKQQAGLRTDPLTYADDQGLIEVPSIMGQQDPVKAISERIQQGDKVADIYQIEPKYLRQEEKAFLSKQFHEMESQDKLKFLAGIDKGAGAKARKFLSEMSDIDPSLSHVGGLYLVGRKEAAMLAMQGMEVMKDKGLKDITERLKGADVNTAYTNYFGNTFGPDRLKAAGPFLSTAKAIATTLMVQGKHENVSDALEEGMKRATGETEVNGEQYGGVDEYADQSYLVHPDTKAAVVYNFFDLLSSGSDEQEISASSERTGISSKELTKDADIDELLEMVDQVRPIDHDTHKPITADRMQEAQYRSIIPGVYEVLVDGVPLLDARKGTEENGLIKYGKKFILDLRNISEPTDYNVGKDLYYDRKPNLKVERVEEDYPVDQGLKVAP